jgi:putative transposase
MGCLIRLCLANGVEPWFIPLAEPWRNDVVEKLNDHYRGGLLRRVVMKGVGELHRESLLSLNRSIILGIRVVRARDGVGSTTTADPFAGLFQGAAASTTKARSRPYHLVRFIRSDDLLDVFSEKFRLPSEAIYEYVIANINVPRQKLRVTVDQVVIEEHDLQAAMNFATGFLWLRKEPGGRLERPKKPKPTKHV